MAIAKLHLKYTVLDVFTTSAWAQGNPLAVVQLTMEAASQINQEQKQFIAREFNFSETTFLHNYSAAAVKEEESKIRVDIFTKTTEVPFAGHPTIGTAFYCFEHVFHGDSEGGVLITKAGDIPIRRDSTGLIGADVPCHNYRVHSQGPGTVTGKSVIDQHPELQDVSGSLPLDFQVISIAKGLFFIPVEIDSLEIMANLRPAKPPAVEHILDDGFAGAIGGIMFYHEISSPGDSRRFRVRRMTSLGEEDPATGSAACAFSVWQTQRKYRDNPEKDLSHRTTRYEIEQGVEMGRKSEIIVDVTLTNDLSPKKVVLLGHATKVMKGELTVDLDSLEKVRARL